MICELVALTDAVSKDALMYSKQRPAKFNLTNHNTLRV